MRARPWLMWPGYLLVHAANSSAESPTVQPSPLKFQAAAGHSEAAVQSLLDSSAAINARNNTPSPHLPSSLTKFSNEALAVGRTTHLEGGLGTAWCTDVYESELEWEERTEDSTADEAGEIGAVILEPAAGTVLYAGGERLPNHAMGYTDTHTNPPGCMEFPAVIISTISINRFNASSAVLMLGVNDAHKQLDPEHLSNLPRLGSLNVLLRIEVPIQAPGYHNLHVWVLDSTSRFWDERTQKYAYRRSAYAASGQFQVRSRKVPSDEDEPRSGLAVPGRQSALAERVQAQRLLLPNPCTSLQKSRNVRTQITVFSIARHVTAYFDVKMLLERLLGLEVRWIEEGLHGRCHFRRDACPTLNGMIGPNAVVPRMNQAQAAQDRNASAESLKKSSDAFYEQFRNELADVDLFLCSNHWFTYGEDCFRYERFNKPIVLYLVDTFDKTHEPRWEYMMRQTMITTSPWQQEFIRARGLPEPAYAPRYGVHSLSEWLPTSANRFLVHVGKYGTHMRAAEFQAKLLHQASKLPDIQLSPVPSMAFEADDNDGTGTWEKTYVHYTGLVYFPYHYTGHVIQAYRLQVVYVCTRSWMCGGVCVRARAPCMYVPDTDVCSVSRFAQDLGFWPLWRLGHPRRQCGHMASFSCLQRWHPVLYGH